MQPDAREPDDADERAWQAIIDNYGDRPDLADLEEPPGPPAASAPPVAPTSDTPAVRPDAPFGGRFGDPRAFDPYDEYGEDADDPYVGPEPEEEGYVPPEPPPLPTVAPDRFVAWAGVLGSPVVLLAALIFKISIPTWLGYGLVAAFVGGFLYLVMKMSREPRDPWDDGAQV
ncbi:hypothetical protein [Nocardioides mangrovi]|uniref:DUF308 domain-containing protein n=1 Tax=Nocardioides mangrovi TaxID=2874580 RepID=A0ABS7U7B2_9ACTN|nr:hypothetical protein [Nocardioides mangrovi]MBZ5736770.1 hypothetical protein [Nocardioides mangrovi]